MMAQGGRMGNKKNLSLFLVLDIIAAAALFLMPEDAGGWTVRRIVMIILAISAVILLVLISRMREKERHVQIVDIDSVSQMNPGQYLSKGGPVCAGSDGRYHVTFLLKDDSGLTLSLSARQAAPLAKGMRGTLVHNGSVFVEFKAEE